MKEYELQNPKNNHHPQANRRSKSKSISNYTKKTQQISKKCLDSAFTSVSEDASLELPSIEVSSISEISNDLQLVESAESSILTPSSVISPSPETVALYDLSDDIVAVEAEMVVKHLKLARAKLMNSTNVDVSSRKLLDALIEFVVEEFGGLHEEKDRFAESVLMKRRVVFVSVLLWIAVVLVIFLFRSCSGRSSFGEPLPT